MRDLTKLKERFLRDPGPVRLGHLASDLRRLSKWVQMGRPEESVIDLMREIAWLMEGTGEMASAEIADMQREICRWRRVRPIEPVRSILSFRASQRSHQLLERSGLLKDGRLGKGKWLADESS